MGGLIPTAEEITLKRKAKKIVKTYFVEDEAESSEDIEEEGDGKEDGAESGPPNPKLEAKKAMKAERKEKRK
jgi:hypothetical protein